MGPAQQAEAFRVTEENRTNKEKKIHKLTAQIGRKTAKLNKRNLSLCLPFSNFFHGFIRFMFLVD
ncbi:LOW QUALITY PROTEIN: hypothetical protein NC652_011409 [Populus alba x Populus x berolinensis]|nr:LOW QUALITY PROTEIN: hypothetical protein NC652_011409 [Populus alba x Populus x berolinensis]